SVIRTRLVLSRGFTTAINSECFRELTGGHERITGAAASRTPCHWCQPLRHRALGLVLHDLRSAPDACERRLRMLAHENVQAGFFLMAGRDPTAAVFHVAIMMIAMMLPSALPMILTFAAVTR